MEQSDTFHFEFSSNDRSYSATATRVMPPWTGIANTPADSIYTVIIENTSLDLLVTKETNGNYIFSGSLGDLGKILKRSDYEDAFATAEKKAFPTDLEIPVMINYPLEFTCESGNHVVVNELSKYEYELSVTFPDGNKDKFIWSSGISTNATSDGVIPHHRNEALLILHRLQTMNG
ncbi:hypothetical protein KTO58_01190 [Chitinophaga pendula]|uniref:hypothetical protein n=1 Tax=Chitinophaga TaxID=79328 RepID=UPI000BB0C1A8|nr:MULTISPECIES: hypothetical protein [Chitinophaga]ASZ14524.1 hypothetical protein CK934_28035 [Chitinophaga sp. MD30]UCJ07820.1 hypothetical protein KTO58_01190 [Chitinophaga pendula]